jgi:hypothetical protein
LILKDLLSTQVQLTRKDFFVAVPRCMDCEGFFFSTQVQWTLKGFSSGTMCNGLWRISSWRNAWCLSYTFRTFIWVVLFLFRAQRPSIKVKLMIQSITLKVIFHLCTASLVSPHRFEESE